VGPHLEVKHSLVRIRKVTFDLVSTHVEIVTSKSYMDAYVAKEVNLEVVNLIATSKSTNILDFFSKIKR
jgi:hypothetical protein